MSQCVYVKGQKVCCACSQDCIVAWVLHHAKKIKAKKLKATRVSSFVHYDVF
jgi:hypothetical protein